ncbi:hypothetical protein EPO34_03245 [Patescibacteria group bacterium]|nr:MAG: hypothetical protein EPO34_03245 [Patescibacteria group bacterium]
MGLWDRFKQPSLRIRGGIAGVMVCIALAVYYVGFSLPAIDRAYGGMVPDGVLMPMTLTGHFFPIFSHFIVPYGLFCPFNEQTCTHWSLYEEPGSTPWTDKEGGAGYCIDLTNVPSDFCAGFSERLGFVGLSLLLLGSYFAVGYGVGLGIERWKRHSRY